DEVAGGQQPGRRAAPLARGLPQVRRETVLRVVAHGEAFEPVGDVDVAVDAALRIDGGGEGAAERPVIAEEVVQPVVRMKASAPEEAGAVDHAAGAGGGAVDEPVFAGVEDDAVERPAR